jgi:hypothetical protein
MRNKTVFADMTVCEPRSAISQVDGDGVWLGVDYQTDDTTGVMIFGLPGSELPDLTLLFGVKGWYEIRLGIYYGAGAGAMADRILCAKLTDDAAFSRFARESFRLEKDGEYPDKHLGCLDIAEAYWKSADLTGQNLVISRPASGDMSLEETNLAYVCLVPMDEAAVARWRAELPTAETKTLIGNYDGGTFGQWGISTRNDYLAEFECLRESDFDIALYGIARGTIAFHPSKVAEFVGRKGNFGHGNVFHESLANGLDPLREAIRAAHECGVKLFPQNRLIGTQLPPRHLKEHYGGAFMSDHLEWNATYPDGQPTRHLSLAFPEVRAQHTALMREWVEDYEADGVNLLFSRSYPFVYYEQPVRERFRDMHGEDMTTFPPWDERVQSVRASFVTDFLREIRAMLDEVGDAQGRYIPTCYLAPVGNSASNTPAFIMETSLSECLYNGLDVPIWIREGLVDYLVVHAHMFRQHDGTEMMPKIREFTDLAEGTGTKVMVDVYPRRMPPRQYRKIAQSYYEAGADGLAFWDSYGRYLRSSEWAFIKRLGHRDDLPDWEGKGDDNYRVVPLRSLDGYVMDREFSMPSDG